MGASSFWEFNFFISPSLFWIHWNLQPQTLAHKSQGGQEGLCWSCRQINNQEDAIMQNWTSSPHRAAHGDEALQSSSCRPFCCLGVVQRACLWVSQRRQRKLSRSRSGHGGTMFTCQVLILLPTSLIWMLLMGRTWRLVCVSSRPHAKTKTSPSFTEQEITSVHVTGVQGQSRERRGRELKALTDHGSSQGTFRSRASP